MFSGGSGWDEAVDAAIADVPSHLRVVRPGYLRFADLPGFLGGATIVAFPLILRSARTAFEAVDPQLDRGG